MALSSNDAYYLVTSLPDQSDIKHRVVFIFLCEGKDILTIEGLADSLTGELHPVQKTFIELSGMQCGVCTPGMILTAKA